MPALVLDGASGWNVLAVGLAPVSAPLTSRTAAFALVTNLCARAALALAVSAAGLAVRFLAGTVTTRTVAARALPAVPAPIGCPATRVDLLTQVLGQVGGVVVPGAASVGAVAELSALPRSAVIVAAAGLRSALSG